MICIALLCLHKMKIVHRDLKPENIFLCFGGSLKVGDFGLSRRFDPNRKTTIMMTKMCGSFLYMAPEQFIIDSVLKRSTITTKVDVWAVGIIAYELCTGNVPFDGSSSNQIEERIIT